MKKILVAALMVILMTPLSAHAFDWGSLFRWLFFSTETTTKTKDISNYLTVASDIRNSAKTTDDALETLLLDLIPALSVQKDALNFTNKIKSVVSAQKTESEQNTQLVQILNDYATNLQNNKLAVILIIKTMTSSDKKELSDNISSLTKYSQKYTELAQKAYNSATELQKYTAYSDEQAKILNEINTVNTEMKNKANALQNLTTTLKLFGKLGGLEF